VAAPTFNFSRITAYDAVDDIKTTAVFDVAINDRLVGFGNNGDEGDNGVGLTGTASPVWTLDQHVEVTNYAELFAWSKSAASAESGVSVDFTRLGSLGLVGGTILSFSASDGFGATQSANATGAPSLSITTTQANSAIAVAVIDWNAVDGSSRTWRNVNGLPTEIHYQLVSGAVGIYIAYYPDAGAIGAKTVGLTAPGGQQYSIAAREILGTAAAATAPPVPTRRAPNLMAALSF
jgi:hypothetical protein